MDAKSKICGFVWLEEGFRHICALKANHKKLHKCAICQKESDLEDIRTSSEVIASFDRALMNALEAKSE